MAVTKRKPTVAVRTRKPVAKDTDLRLAALAHAINVSGLEHVSPGNIGGWPTGMGQAVARGRYQAPSEIVKTATTFLMFLKGS